MPDGCDRAPDALIRNASGARPVLLPMTKGIAHVTVTVHTGERIGVDLINRPALHS